MISNLDISQNSSRARRMQFIYLFTFFIGVENGHKIIVEPIFRFPADDLRHPSLPREILSGTLAFFDFSLKSDHTEAFWVDYHRFKRVDITRSVVIKLDRLLFPMQLRRASRSPHRPTQLPLCIFGGTFDDRQMSKFIIQWSVNKSGSAGESISCILTI